jgi:arginase
MARDEGVTVLEAPPGGQTAVPLVLAPTNAGLPAVTGLREGPARALAALVESSRQRGAEGRQWDVEWVEAGDGRSIGPNEAAGAVGAAAAVKAVAAEIAAAVARRVAAGQVPVVLGGDHTVALGSVEGVRRGLRERGGEAVPLYLLWLDAHPDVNTRETSPSGHLHGMVLSGLLGVGPLAVMDPLPAGRVTLAGVRALDPGEVASLRARPELTVWGVEQRRTGDVSGRHGGAATRGGDDEAGRDGWTAALARLLKQVQRAGGRLYVSVDLDVVDPRWAPGVAVPAAGGVRPELVLEVARQIQRSGLLVGADVVELYPDADVEGQTARLAAAVVETMVGKTGGATQRPAAARLRRE